jgi:hypothetical protein
VKDINNHPFFIALNLGLENVWVRASYSYIPSSSSSSSTSTSSMICIFANLTH